MFKQRRRIQTKTLKERIGVFAKLMRERAELMPPGPEKAATLAKADRAEATAEFERWINSPERPK
jgi:hypothetical protein